MTDSMFSFFVVGGWGVVRGMDMNINFPRSGKYSWILKKKYLMPEFQLSPPEAAHFRYARTTTANCVLRACG